MQTEFKQIDNNKEEKPFEFYLENMKNWIQKRFQNVVIFLMMKKHMNFLFV